MIISKAKETMMKPAQTLATAHVGVWSSSLDCEPLTSSAAIAVPTHTKQRLIEKRRRGTIFGSIHRERGKNTAFISPSSIFSATTINWDAL